MDEMALQMLIGKHDERAVPEGVRSGIRLIYLFDYMALEIHRIRLFI